QRRRRRWRSIREVVATVKGGDSDGGDRKPKSSREKQHFTIIGSQGTNSSININLRTFSSR
ncbi:hypothetical protein LINPERHAP1_LOCUS9129, partial [Linum perenne]